MVYCKKLDMKFDDIDEMITYLVSTGKVKMPAYLRELLGRNFRNNIIDHIYDYDARKLDEVPNKHKFRKPNNISNYNHLKYFQYALDSKILSKAKAVRSEIVKQKLIALQVEFYELFNELKFFKYWKHQEKDNEKVLEEYADCIHFIVSLAIDYKLDLDFNNSRIPDWYNLEDVFETMSFQLALYNNQFQLCKDNDEKKAVLRAIVGIFLQIESFLEFKRDDVIKAYFKKYKINIKRLENY